MLREVGTCGLDIGIGCCPVNSISGVVGTCVLHHEGSTTVEVVFPCVCVCLDKSVGKMYGVVGMTLKESVYPMVAFF